MDSRVRNLLTVDSDFVESSNRASAVNLMAFLPLEWGKRRKRGTCFADSPANSYASSASDVLRDKGKEILVIESDDDDDDIVCRKETASIVRDKGKGILVVELDEDDDDDDYLPSDCTQEAGMILELENAVQDENYLPSDCTQEAGKELELEKAVKDEDHLPSDCTQEAGKMLELGKAVKDEDYLPSDCIQEAGKILKLEKVVKKEENNLIPAVGVSTRRDNSQKTYRCNECGKVFTNFRGLGGHVSAHNRKRRMQELPGTIVAEINNGQPKKRRIMQVPLFDEEGPSSIVIAAINDHRCHMCNKSFPTGQALGGHKRLHYKGRVARPSVVPKFEGQVARSSLLPKFEGRVTRPSVAPKFEGQVACPSVVPKFDLNLLPPEALEDNGPWLLNFPTGQAVAASPFQLGGLADGLAKIV